MVGFSIVYGRENYLASLYTVTRRHCSFCRFPSNEGGTFLIIITIDTRSWFEIVQRDIYIYIYILCSSRDVSKEKEVKKRRLGVASKQFRIEHTSIFIFSSAANKHIKLCMCVIPDNECIVERSDFCMQGKGRRAG